MRNTTLPKISLLSIKPILLLRLSRETRRLSPSTKRVRSSTERTTTCPTRGLRKGGSSRVKEEGTPRSTVADSSHYEAHDDAAELFFLPPSRIRPEDFGLDSIRQGVQRFLEEEAAVNSK